MCERLTALEGWQLWVECLWLERVEWQFSQDLRLFRHDLPFALMVIVW